MRDAERYADPDSSPFERADQSCAEAQEVLAGLLTASEVKRDVPAPALDRKDVFEDLLFAFGLTDTLLQAVLWQRDAIATRDTAIVRRASAIMMKVVMALKGELGVRGFIAIHRCDLRQVDALQLLVEAALREVSRNQQLLSPLATGRGASQAHAM